VLSLKEKKKKKQQLLSDRIGKLPTVLSEKLHNLIFEQANLLNEFQSNAWSNASSTKENLNCPSQD